MQMKTIIRSQEVKRSQNAGLALILQYRYVGALKVHVNPYIDQILNWYLCITNQIKKAVEDFNVEISQRHWIITASKQIAK